MLFHSNLASLLDLQLGNPDERARVSVCVRARACVCVAQRALWGGGAHPPTFEQRVCVAEQAQHVRDKRPVFVRVLRELIVHSSTVMHPEHPQEIFPAELAIGEPTFIYEDLQAVCVFMPREVLQEEAYIRGLRAADAVFQQLQTTA